MARTKVVTIDRKPELSPLWQDMARVVADASIRLGSIASTSELKPMLKPKDTTHEPEPERPAEPWRCWQPRVAA